jgi:flagellar hook-associated protein FlgK
MGTFDTFTAARLGLYAAQKGLAVTGNNISNINTEGYTRQVLDQVSLKTGGADRYRSQYDAHVGTGVLVTSTSQIRDQYLDIRYRTEEASVGMMDTTVNGLEQIADILDEVGDGENDGDGIIEAQLSDVFDMLQNLSLNAGHDEYDDLVRESASSLCTLLNSYAKKLENVRTNTVTELYQEVDTVNSTLTKIRDLNSEIRKSEIHGDSALELRDERNVLIDELSEYMKIDVTYEMEDLGGGVEVEKLRISLGNNNTDTKGRSATDSLTLVDGIYAAQIDVGLVDEWTDAANFRLGTDTATEENERTYQVVVSALTDSKGKTQEGKSAETTVKAADIVDIYQSTLVDPSQTKFTTAKNNGDTELPDTFAVQNVDINGNFDGTYTVYTRVGAAENEEGAAIFAAIDVGNDTTYYTAATYTALDDNDLYGKIQAYRELLTESGEFASDKAKALDEDATTKRGIIYYQKSLDLLANKIATEFNNLNQGYRVDTTGDFVTAGGQKVVKAYDLNNDPIYLNQTDLENASDDVSKKWTEYLENGYLVDTANNVCTDLEGNQLEDGNGNPISSNPDNWTAEQAELIESKRVAMGGVLFSNRGDSDDTDNITASNISISSSWSTSSVRIVNSYTATVADQGVPTTARDNIDRFVSLMDKSMDYKPSDIGRSSDNVMFQGSFQEMLTRISAVLGDDTRSANVQLDTSNAAAVALDTSRESVSGVDLNDEAMNMIQYQKAYSAACRLITVLDEALDKLINGTGTAGL